MNDLTFNLFSLGQKISGLLKHSGLYHYCLDFINSLEDSPLVSMSAGLSLLLTCSQELGSVIAWISTTQLAMKGFHWCADTLIQCKTIVELVHRIIFSILLKMVLMWLDFLTAIKAPKISNHSEIILFKKDPLET